MLDKYTKNVMISLSLSLMQFSVRRRWYDPNDKYFMVSCYIRLFFKLKLHLGDPFKLGRKVYKKHHLQKKNNIQFPIFN